MVNPYCSSERLCRQDAKDIPVETCSHLSSVAWTNSAGFTQCATRRVVDEFADGEMVRSATEEQLIKGSLRVLHLMEERSLCADGMTYSWLLDGCLNFGKLLDVKRLHAKILILGFGAECHLAERFVDLYANFGILDDAVSMFDEMCTRSLHAWNSILSGWPAKSMNHIVLEAFSRMANERAELNHIAFTSAIRARSELNHIEYGIGMSKFSLVIRRIVESGKEADDFLTRGGQIMARREWIFKRRRASAEEENRRAEFSQGNSVGFNEFKSQV